MEALNKKGIKALNNIILSCHHRDNHRPRIKVTVVKIAESQSVEKVTRNDFDEPVKYRTDLFLYRSKTKYYLNILGVSDHPEETTRYRVVTFESPKKYFELIDDPEISYMYLSEPAYQLLEQVITSEYLTDKEKKNWEKELVGEEEE